MVNIQGLKFTSKQMINYRIFSHRYMWHVSHPNLLKQVIPRKTKTEKSLHLTSFLQSEHEELRFLVANGA